MIKLVVKAEVQWSDRGSDGFLVFINLWHVHPRNKFLCDSNVNSTKMQMITNYNLRQK